MNFFKKLAKSVKSAVQSFVDNSPVVKAVQEIVSDVKNIVSNSALVSGFNNIVTDIKDIGNAISGSFNSVVAVFSGKKSLAEAWNDMINGTKTMVAEFNDISKNISSIIKDKGLNAQVTDLVSDVKAINSQVLHLNVVGHLFSDIQKLVTSPAVTEALAKVGQDVKAALTDATDIINLTKDILAGKNIDKNVTSLISEAGSIWSNIKNAWGDVQTMVKDPAVAAAIKDMGSDISNEANAYIKDAMDFLKGTSADLSARVDEIWNSNKVFDTSVIGSVAGTSGSDLIYSALSVNKTIDAGNGNDVIVNTIGDGTYKGGAGNDIIYGGLMGTHVLDGGTGNDILYGGHGQDTMLGGGGIDTFIWGKGDGNDSVVGDKDDRVVVYNMKHDALSLSLQGNDLVIGADTANNLTIKDWNNNANAVNKFSMGGELGLSYKVTNDNGKLSWTNV